MKPVNINKPIDKLLPLDVKCSDTRCDEGYHFYTSAKVRKNGHLGDCKKCGDNSIDWHRLYESNPNDIQYTFECLKKELLRHICWENKVNDEVINFAKKRGKKIIIQKAKDIITKKIAKIPTGHFDYMATPKKGKEIIHYAQHATATCCRKCIERWHNIPQNILLNEEQIQFCVSLIEMYVNDRIPNLPEEGVNIK